MRLPKLILYFSILLFSNKIIARGYTGGSSDGGKLLMIILIVAGSGLVFWYIGKKMGVTNTADRVLIGAIAFPFIFGLLYNIFN
jgi:hypothetical protein